MEPKFLLCGDSALLVQMGDEISLEVNGKVLALQCRLEVEKIEGITEMVPTYASLMIHYNPRIIRIGALKQQIERVLEKVSAESSVEKKEKVIVEIPILYGGELGPDLELCAQLDGTTTDEIIRKHSQHDYYVYMLGFAPGHPYSARFEEPFAFKRRETARISIPARSVVVQQNLSDLIPFEQPCGWNIIGSTPVEICDYRKKDPFVVHAGEWTRYVPVNQKEYARIRKQVENGTYKVKIIREA